METTFSSEQWKGQTVGAAVDYTDAVLRALLPFREARAAVLAALTEAG